MIKKLTQKKMKSLGRSAKERIWQVVRHSILERDRYCCVLCGSKKGDIYVNKAGKEQKVILEVHHLIERDLPNFKHLIFNPRNLITLCSKCHKWGEFSVHRNPVYALQVIKDIYPENYKFLLEEIKRVKHG